MRQVPQLRQDLSEPVPHLGQVPVRLTVGRICHRHRQLGGQGQQVLLHAIMQVAFDTPSFRQPRLDDTRPGGADLFQLLTRGLRLELGVLQRQAARLDGGVEQPRYLARAGSAMTTAMGEPSSVRMNSTRRSGGCSSSTGPACSVSLPPPPSRRPGRPGQARQRTDRGLPGSGHEGCFAARSDRADVGPTGDLSRQRGYVPERGCAAWQRPGKPAVPPGPPRFRRYRRRSECH